MRRFIIMSAVLALAFASAAAAQGTWVQLFNGKDLSGWTPKIKGYALGDNFGSTFRVQEGVIRVGYEAYGQFNERFGHLFYKEPFTNYHLRVEYRFIGEQVAGGPGWAFANSGVMIHGQAPESMGKDQNFPVSIEVQLLGDDGSGKRPTGNLCTPGTHVVMNGALETKHCINSTSKTYPIGQWVTAEIIVSEGKIRHIIEGETVLEYSEPQYDEKDKDAKLLMGDSADVLIKGGTISLQSESHPVEFRKVEIMELPR